MKKLLVIAAMILAQNAQAADEVPSLLTAEANTTKAEKPAKPAKPLTLQQQIAADAQRDPYAETPESPIKYQIKETTVVEGYEPPVAAEYMKPSKMMKLKKGNTVVKTIVK